MTTHNVLLAPPARWVAALGIGAALLAFATASYKPRTYRLSLEAPMQPSCVYFSAWEDGAVVADHDASDGRTVVMTRQFTWLDGCTWEAIETLTPIAATRYHYAYDERPVSCPRGLTANGIRSPRTGVVTVEPADAREAVTATSGFAAGRPAGWRDLACETWRRAAVDSIDPFLMVE